LVTIRLAFSFLPLRTNIAVVILSNYNKKALTMLNTNINYC